MARLLARLILLLVGASRLWSASPTGMWIGIATAATARASWSSATITSTAGQTAVGPIVVMGGAATHRRACRRRRGRARGRGPRRTGGGHRRRPGRRGRQRDHRSEGPHLRRTSARPWSGSPTSTAAGIRCRRTLDRRASRWPRPILRLLIVFLVAAGPCARCAGLGARGFRGAPRTARRRRPRSGSRARSGSFPALIAPRRHARGHGRRHSAHRLRALPGGRGRGGRCRRLHGRRRAHWREAPRHDPGGVECALRGRARWVCSWCRRCRWRRSLLAFGCVLGWPGDRGASARSASCIEYVVWTIGIGAACATLLARWNGPATTTRRR